MFRRMVAMNTTTAAEPVLSGLASLIPNLEALYKDVHTHPELSMQETRTAGLAADRLRAAGYAVTTGVGKTGVVGLLRNGDGPTVMLRADMDALPIEEARHQRSPPCVACLREQRGRSSEPGYVQVVTAHMSHRHRVPLAVLHLDLAGIRKARRLLDGQGIHVGAQH